MPGTAAPHPKASVLQERETHFSWLRTRMSVERTLMSWMRTSTALIGIGTLAIVVAILQYRQLLHYLWSEEFRDIAGVGDRPGSTPTLAAAVLLAIVGLAAFFAIAVRVWR